MDFGCANEPPRAKTSKRNYGSGEDQDEGDTNLLQRRVMSTTRVESAPKRRNVEVWRKSGGSLGMLSRITPQEFKEQGFESAQSTKLVNVFPRTIPKDL